MSAGHSTQPQSKPMTHPPTQRDASIDTSTLMAMVVGGLNEWTLGGQAHGEQAQMEPNADIAT